MLAIFTSLMPFIQAILIICIGLLAMSFIGNCFNFSLMFIQFLDSINAKHNGESKRNK